MKTITLNVKTLVTIGILISMIILGGLYLQNNKITSLKNDVESEVKLKTALLDTITTYRNKYNEVVSEKKTIQATNSQLKSVNDQLTKDQKELLYRVKDANKKNVLITAALIKTKIKLDSVMNGTSVVDDSAKTVTFYSNKKDTTLNYELKAFDVKRSNINKMPTIKFVNFEMLNTSFVKFQWDKKSRTDYPVSFSVSNSNKYFTTANIESYAIPELQKDLVKPSFWNKLGSGIKTGGKLGIGVGVGVGLGFLIFK